MSVATLDPRTALIVIDLQKGLLALPTVHPISAVLECVSGLASAFRRHGLPVVLVNVTGAPVGRTETTLSVKDLPIDWADLATELNAQTEDILVTKKTWGAFTDTNLETRLKKLGITQVVIAGVSTSIGVESTARQAHELGFNVTLALDAMTDTNQEAHDNSVTRIFPRLGESGPTKEIIAIIDGANRPK
ncbi:isochorismatase family protein [Pseudomonas sp. ES3-33]|uniref:isochorismatase family protein n=1 Tax=Pseudomonas sp. ES3-33 TaxID=1628833 RepID=UPI0005D3C0BB|nr:isochorismatase family protein [Pseudomonas sp. ES3-33]KJH73706.1 hydrolase [Pseudomonas sp. ES3-33]